MHDFGTGLTGGLLDGRACDPAQHKRQDDCQPGDYGHTLHGNTPLRTGRVYQKRPPRKGPEGPGTMPLRAGILSDPALVSPHGQGTTMRGHRHRHEGQEAAMTGGEQHGPDGDYERLVDLAERLAT